MCQEYRKRWLWRYICLGFHGSGLVLGLRGCLVVFLLHLARCRHVLWCVCVAKWQFHVRKTSGIQGCFPSSCKFSVLFDYAAKREMVDNLWVLQRPGHHCQCTMSLESSQLIIWCATPGSMGLVPGLIGFTSAVWAGCSSVLTTPSNVAEWQMIQGVCSCRVYIHLICLGSTSTSADNWKVASFLAFVTTGTSGRAVSFTWWVYITTIATSGGVYTIVAAVLISWSSRVVVSLRHNFNCSYNW